jgi:hypothetical protein
MKYIMILSVLLMVGCAKRAAEAKLEQQTLLNVQRGDTTVAQAIRLSTGEYGVQLCSRTCTVTGYHFIDKADAISKRDEFNAERPTVVEVVE